MMQLRRLQPQDAPLMLEWMHDADAVQHMRANFAAMTLADCDRFIAAAQKDTPALHRAIADENGTYQGTVSLKNIDPAKGEAEFAIAVRRCAMGRGVSAWGMREILHLGFAELGLRRIYWCVDPVNARACRFYAKQGYTPITPEPDAENLLWFEVFA